MSNRQPLHEHQERVEAFGRQHRSGLVTLMFTDLVGSTELKQELGDRAGVARIQVHHDLVRRLLAEVPDAEEISTAGDSFFLIFARPSDAVRFALQLQRALRSGEDAGSSPLRDRIGIHVGEVFIEESGGRAKDLWGLQVDICARVMGLAGPDQILMTAFAFESARGVLGQSEESSPPRVFWKCHGNYALKGVGGPVEIFEVGDEGAALQKAPEGAGAMDRPEPAAGSLSAPKGPGSAGGLRRVASWGFLVSLAGLGLIGLLLAAMLQWMKGQSATDPCLVILPFREPSQERSAEMLADGLAETMVSRLTHLGRGQRMPVIVPISEVLSAGVDSLKSARGRLGATLVVSGKLTASGGRMRLFLDLSETGSGKVARVLQSGTFDQRDDESLFMYHDRVAEVVAGWVGMRPRTLDPAARFGSGEGMGEGPDPQRLRSAEPEYLKGVGALVSLYREGRRDLALAHLTAAVSACPEFAEAHAMLGEAYYWKYDETREVSFLDLAERSCLRALELNTHLALGHSKYGFLLGRTGRREKALEHLRQAVQLSPNDPRSRADLAQGQFSLGDREGAERTYLEAIALHPGYWYSHNRLGGFYLSTGDTEEAEACFKAVVRLTPDNYIGYLNLGVLYFNRNQFDLAEIHLKEAAGREPLDPAALGVVHANLGTLSFWRGDFGEAIRQYERAMDKDSRRYTHYGNLADACRWSEDPAQASRAPGLYRKAVQMVAEELGKLRELGGDDSDARASLALYLASLGDRAAAVKEMDEVLRREPKSGEFQFVAALTFELTGDRFRSLRSLQAALMERFPTNQILAHPDLKALRTTEDFARLWAAVRPPAPKP